MRILGADIIGEVGKGNYAPLLQLTSEKHFGYMELRDLVLEQFRIASAFASFGTKGNLGLFVRPDNGNVVVCFDRVPALNPRVLPPRQNVSLDAVILGWKAEWRRMDKTESYTSVICAAAEKNFCRAA